MYFIATICFLFIQHCKSHSYVILDQMMDQISLAVKDDEFNNIINHNLATLADEYPEVLAALDLRINNIAKQV